MEIQIKHLIAIKLYKQDETSNLTFLQKMEMSYAPRVGEFFSFYHRAEHKWSGGKIEAITHSFNKEGGFEALDVNLIID